MQDPRPDRLTAALVFFAVLVMYLLWTAKELYGDGLYLTTSIESAAGLNSELLHPGHLLYEPLGYLVHRFVRWFADVRAAAVLQYVNCLTAAASAAILHRILRSVIGSGWLSVCLTVLFAFAATWWKLATVVNPLVPSIFFLLIVFYLLLPGKYEQPFAIGIIHTLSIALHYLAVLFFPVALVGVFMQTRGLPPGERRVQALKYVATVTVLTLATYLFSFLLTAGDADPNRFWAWIRSGTAATAFDAAANLRSSITGQLKLFGRGSLSPLQEEPGSFTIFLLVLLAGLACGLIYELFIQRRRRLPVRYRASPRRPGVAGMCALWIAVYTVFLFFHNPAATEYRLFYLPAIIILLGIWLSDRRWLPAAKRPLSLAVAMMVVSNLIFFIYPATHATPAPAAIELPIPRQPQPVAEEKTAEPR